MARTRAGGLLAAAIIRTKHGNDFFKRIGAEGGKRGTTGGFACQEVGDDGLTDRERAKVVGRTGGMISRITTNKELPCKHI